METTAGLLLQRQHGEGNLSNMLQTSEAISTLCARSCTHIRAFAPTEQRENQQAKALHAAAAFPSDVRTDMLKYSYLPKSGGKRDPQSIFGGAEWVLTRCQSRCEGREELLLHWILSPDQSQGLRRQHDSLLMAVISFLLFQWPLPMHWLRKSQTSRRLVSFSLGSTFWKTAQLFGFSFSVC